MTEKAKKQKKCSISEEDVSTLLQRYNHTTVLTLLQEVVQFANAKIDWNALVKKTSTGITNAREYQMLWRHLAYRHALDNKLEDGAEPLDDDSDLEYELEASPSVSPEASTDAAATVKVLIASALQNDSRHPNHSTIEASLTINIPSGQLSGTYLENSQSTSSMQGINITVPVSVQKQPLPTGMAAENSDANGVAGSSLPPRKRRKPWTAAEDRELIAAVQKCGEGNWANILKGDFTGDRTASQLSQRWAIIRKRNGNLNLGGANSNGQQLSQAQLAARHAMSVALNMPVGNLTVANSLAVTASAPTETFSGGSSLPQSQTASQGLTQTSPPTVSSISVQKSRHAVKKSVAKPITSPNFLLQAAAVAAGARIATPEDAASLLKAAQAKNAVHIMPGGGSLIKSSTSSLSVSHLGAQNNIHYVRTGMSASSVSAYSASMPSTSKAGLAKPSTQISQSSNPASSGIAYEKTNAATSMSKTAEVSSKEEVETVEEMKISSSCDPHVGQENEPVLSENAPSQQIRAVLSTQESQACVTVHASDQQVQNDQTNSPIGQRIHSQEYHTFAADTEISQQIKGDRSSSISVKDEYAVGETKHNVNTEEDKNETAANKVSDNEGTSEEQKNLPSVAVSGSNDKLLLQIESTTTMEV